jgi:hypothetical protein
MLALGTADTLIVVVVMASLGLIAAAAAFAILTVCFDLLTAIR